MKPLIFWILISTFFSTNTAYAQSWLEQLGNTADQLYQSGKETADEVAKESQKIYESAKEQAGEAAQATSETAQDLYQRSQRATQEAIRAFQADPKAAAYCYDKERLQYWDERIAAYPNNIDIIKLYGLWRGLCQMMEEGRISLQTAQKVLSLEQLAMH